MQMDLIDRFSIMLFDLICLWRTSKTNGSLECEQDWVTPYIVVSSKKKIVDTSVRFEFQFDAIVT